MSDDTMVPTGDFAIAVYSDIGCPWANIAVHRLTRTLSQLGLDREIGIDHRAFSLERFNDGPLPSELLNAEIPTCRDLEPTAPWPAGDGPWRFSGSTQWALQAVQAAKHQSIAASVRLDRAYRRAMFADLADLGSVEQVIAIARGVDGVDANALDEALRSGRGAADIDQQTDESGSDLVAGSPTLVLPDGSAHHNPGITMHWEDEPGERLFIESDHPEIYTELVERTLATQPAD
jgi:predicted DsbA family dithiol-disulfide isomerase